MKSYQEKNCMELMEDHHPGRLPIKTVRIPKLVHDLIHQGERDAVSEIFKKDGLKGNPGRWTAKGIPEPVEETPLIYPGLNLPSFGFLKEKTSPEENLRRIVKDSIKKMEEEIKRREDAERKMEEEKIILDLIKIGNPYDSSFLNPMSHTVLKPILPEQNLNSWNINSKPLSVLGGETDPGVLARRKTWEEFDFYAKNSPNGYERNPVHFIAGTGWIKSFSREVNSPIPRNFACGDFITTFAERNKTSSGLPTITFKQPKWY